MTLTGLQKCVCEAVTFKPSQSTSVRKSRQYYNDIADLFFIDRSRKSEVTKLFMHLRYPAAERASTVEGCLRLYETAHPCSPFSSWRLSASPPLNCMQGATTRSLHIYLPAHLWASMAARLMQTVA